MEAEPAAKPQWTPFVAITLAFTIALSYAIVNLDIDVIKKNWDTKRCNPSVMLTGWLYTPDGEDSTEFAINNFSFCINSYIQDALKRALQPVNVLFSKQLESTGVLQQNMNTLRGSTNSLMGGFITLFEPIFRKFQIINQLISNSFTRFKFAMSRMSAMMLSAVFAGLSSIKVVENSMNFIIRVVIIILSILVAIFILLFFVLFPFVPTILTTIGIISATAFGGAVGGMAGTFCVPPGTLVSTREGWKPVETLELGEILSRDVGARSQNRIEGIIRADGSNTPFVSIHDTIISGGHIVWDSYKNVWCAAEDHSVAKPIQERFPIVYCLNTSEHIWRIAKASSYNYHTSIYDIKEGSDITIRDWEELPSEFDTSSIWETKVALQLETSPHTKQPSIRGLLGPATLILTKGSNGSNGEVKRIEDIQVGDLVADLFLGKYSWTRVSAVIRDDSEVTPNDGPNSGCWMRNEVEDSWTHPLYPTLPSQNNSPLSPSLGYHLITESGSFITKAGFYLRDFTEIGIEGLDTFRPWILEKLNSPKIETRQCQCVPQQL